MEGEETIFLNKNLKILVSTDSVLKIKQWSRTKYEHNSPALLRIQASISCLIMYKGKISDGSSIFNQTTVGLYDRLN